MVQIQVTGPLHSKKGYIMVEVARHLRSLGCNVTLQGEETHLAEKSNVDVSTVSEKLMGQDISITELQSTNTW